MEDHQLQGCRAGDVELVAVQVEISDCWVAEADEVAGPWFDVVLGPESAEFFTAGGQIGDEFGGGGVGDIRAEGGAQTGDAVGCRLVPVAAEVSLGRVEEDRAKQVPADRVVRRNRCGDLVCGEDVGEAVLDVRRVCRPGRDQFDDACGHVRLGLAWLRWRGELVQVVAGGFVKTEGPGQCVEHLGGRVLVASLFQADVVVAADSRQEREFFAAQPSDTTPSAVRQPDVGRGDPLASGAEEVAEEGVHLASVFDSVSAVLLRLC